jgi:hypothetical protein
MEKEQALLALKYLIVGHIDGYWGAGDAHLTMLEMLCALDPEDQTLKALYESLKARSDRYIDRSTELPADLLKQFSPAMIKAENIYRDEGKEEARKYEAEIVQRYGKEFFDLFWEAMSDWF